MELQLRASKSGHNKEHEALQPMEINIQNYLKSSKIKQPQQKLPSQQVSPQQNKENQNQAKFTTLFDEYIQLLKFKVFKRKIILFVLNILLTIMALIFAIFFIVWQNTSGKEQTEVKMQEIFNTQTSFLTLICIIFIGILSAVFSVVIIKGKVIMLHCYWISCLVFLIIFSIVGASAFSMKNMNCEQPSSFILQRIRLTSLSANSLFCSDICPCLKSGTNSSNNNATKFYERVQDCPRWEQSIYSSLLSLIEQRMQCSGWCSVNQKSYFTFNQNMTLPVQTQRFSCFDSIRTKIESDTSYLRVFSILLCVMLTLIIFYTNYYIFMEKEDQNREAKKIKKKIKEAQQRMEDELRTSKRMLERVPE